MSPDKAARIAANAEALYEALNEMMGIASESYGIAYSRFDGIPSAWDQFDAATKARAVLRRIEDDSA